MAQTRGFPLRFIQIALADMPPIMQDMIASAIATSPDLVIARRGSTLRSVLPALFDSSLDVVVVQRRRGEDGAPDLGWIPRIIAVDHDGQRAILHAFHARTTALGEISAAGLVAAIRSAGLSMPRGAVDP
jgi:hypothetical protein